MLEVLIGCTENIPVSITKLQIREWINCGSGWYCDYEIEGYMRQYHELQFNLFHLQADPNHSESLWESCNICRI
jgi:hypothetical protein